MSEKNSQKGHIIWISYSTPMNIVLIFPVFLFNIGFIKVKRKISHLRCFYNIFTVIFVCFKGNLKHCIKMFVLYRMELHVRVFLTIIYIRKNNYEIKEDNSF